MPRCFIRFIHVQRLVIEKTAVLGRIDAGTTGALDEEETHIDGLEENMDRRVYMPPAIAAKARASA